VKLAKRIQCPCGTYLDKPEDYQLLFLKKELNEVDILCPNKSCFLRELGYVRFRLTSGRAEFDEASFYPPYVTWNAAQNGSKQTESVLKDHLRKIVTRLIDWQRLDAKNESAE